MSMRIHVTVVIMLLALLGGCHPQTQGEAPFYMYNSGLLNSGGGGISFASSQIDAAPNTERNTATPVQNERSEHSAAVEQVNEKHNAQPAGFKRPGKNAMQVTQKAPQAKKKPSTPSEPEMKYNPADAAGYVMAVYKINGIDLGVKSGENAIAEIYATIKEQGSIYHATRPAVGDLVFFHNTFDRNTDSRNNDWYTHVGLIELVEKDGTIHILSYLDNKIQSFVINLEQPKLAKDDRAKKTWNTKLRARRSDDPPFTQYLGGELFAGFGNILGDRTEFVVIDNWGPEMKSP